MQSNPLDAWLDNGDTPEVNYPSGQNQAPASSTAMANTALKFLGVKYRYGGNGPNDGFDCSGLVAYAAEKSLGLKLPRIAREQAALGSSVKRSELKRGDLVFFNTLGRKFSHVGIYLGNQKFVHAPRSGAKIRIESMDVAYWSKRYNGARRLDTQFAKTGASTLVASQN